MPIELFRTPITLAKREIMVAADLKAVDQILNGK